MKDTDKELSPRYYIAEASIWLLSAILVVSRFLGLAPNQELPILNITPGNVQHFPAVVALLLLAAVLYMVVEWKQSSRVARDSVWQSVRITVTGLAAVASLWISYPLIAQHTRYAGVSPAWYLGFMTIGFLLGMFTSILAFSALMIRSPKESKRLRLPRIPDATRAQFLSWLPLILLLLLGYYCLLFFSPPVLGGIAVAFVLVPFMVMLAEEFASLFLACDDDGRRIPYAERIAQFKEIHDFHDYAYFLIDQGDQPAREMAIPAGATPQAIQQAIQEKYLARQTQAPINFHVKQLEEMQLRFYPKDGNPENSDPQNCGVKIHKRRGKNETIRVLFMPDDANRPQKEMAISAAAVEKYAEEFIREHPDPKDVTFRKMFSHSVNTAVVDAMVEDAGPLLHRLVEGGQEVEIAAALKNHADVNERAAAGWTPLLYASAQAHPRIARMLLDAGANPDIGNVHGITPLMYGARYGNAEICQILLDHEAVVDLQDIYGMTALIVASRDGHSPIVSLLLSAGADPSIATRDGKTAVDFAYARGHGQIAKMLRKANKSIQATK
jgi:hypothetical protein